MLMHVVVKFHFHGAWCSRFFNWTSSSSSSSLFTIVQHQQQCRFLTADAFRRDVIVRQHQELWRQHTSGSTTMIPLSPSKRQMTTSPLTSPAKVTKPVDEKENKASEVDVTPTLFFAKLSDKAHVPTRGSKFAAGYDLKSAYKYKIPAGGKCLVKTDIQIKVPSGHYGRVAPRSGLALKHGIDVGAGVIDEDYRGNVGVILFNFGETDFDVNEGDRIAQLICEKICYPDLVEMKSLDDTERGASGFGSTGVGSTS